MATMPISAVKIWMATTSTAATGLPVVSLALRQSIMEVATPPQLAASEDVLLTAAATMAAVAIANKAMPMRLFTAGFSGLKA